jgi:exosome complex component RRP45
MKEREAIRIEKTFIQSTIQQNLRIDQRNPYDIRPIQIQTGPQLGQALVSYGKTKVFANVSCEIVKPSPSQPTEGSIQFNTQYSPMASNIQDYEKQQEMEINLSRMLEKALFRSRAIDTEGLCIIAGEKVWAIKIDIRVLDHVGNVLDCACLATMVALLHFKRPDVSVDGDEVVVYSEDEKTPISLSIHHIPVCVTFAIFDGGERFVIDPCFEEEVAQDGDMTIVINIHREICTISKTGSVLVEMEKIINCSNIAAIKVAELTKIIKEALNNQ